MNLDMQICHVNHADLSGKCRPWVISGSPAGGWKKYNCQNGKTPAFVTMFLEPNSTRIHGWMINLKHVSLILKKFTLFMIRCVLVLIRSIWPSLWGNSSRKCWEKQESNFMYGGKIENNLCSGMIECISRKKCVFYYHVTWQLRLDCILLMVDKCPHFNRFNFGALFKMLYMSDEAETCLHGIVSLLTQQKLWCHHGKLLLHLD